jgi:trimeric autotransporter adhesin
MAQPTPPPYANIAGIARADMKINEQETIAEYDGNARPGELVVDLTTYNLFIGNADGNLNGFSGGGGTNYANANLVSYLNTGLAGNIIPSANNVYSLGSPTRQWASIYVGANTLYLGATAVSSDGTGLVVGGEPVVTANTPISGNVEADYFIGDGSLLTNLPAGNYSNSNVAAYLPTYSGNVTTITATGNIAANFFIGNGSQLTGVATSAALTATNANVSNTNSNVANLTTSLSNTNSNVSNTNSNVANLTTSLSNTNSNVSNVASNVANLTTSLSNTNSNVANLTTSLSNTNSNVANLTTSVSNTNANVSNVASNVTTLQGQVYTNSNTATFLAAFGSNTITTTGNVQVGNITTSGNVEADYFIGDGSLLTNLPAGNYSNANVANYLPTYSGNIGTGNITFTNNTIYSGSAITLPTTTTGNLNKFSWNFRDLSVGSDTVSLEWNALTTTFGDFLIGTDSDATPYYFTFDGPSQTLGAIPGSGLTGGGKLTFGTATNNGTGNVNAIELTSSTDNVYVRANNNSWLFDNTGNLTIPNGILAQGVSSPAPVISGFSFNGDLRGQVSTTGNVLAGLVSASGNVRGGNLNTAGNVNATGNIAGANISATGNVSANYFVGDGSLLTGITATASLAGNLVGNIDANTFSINNLPSLSVAGNITGNFFVGNGSLLTGITATANTGDITFTDSLIESTSGIIELQANSRIELTSGNTFISVLPQDIELNANVGNVRIESDQDVTVLANGVFSLTNFSNTESIYITTAASSNIYQWDFDNTGNLTLPGNTFAVNYANGTPVSISGGGSANTGNVTFNDITIQGTGDEYGGSGLYLAPGANSTANLQYLRVRGGDYPTHIHFDTGNNQYFDQYFGADDKFVKLEANGNVLINASNLANNSSATWTFDDTGNITLPANGNLNFNIGGITQTINEDLNIVVQDEEDDGWSLYNTITDGLGNNLSQTVLDSSSFTIRTELTGASYSWGFDGNILQVTNDSLIRSFGSNVALQAMNSGNSPVASLQSVSNVNDPNIFTTIDATTTGANIKVYNGGSSGGTEYAWQFDNTGNLTIPNDILSNTTIDIDNRLSSNTADIQLFAADDITLQARDRSAGSTTEGGDINILAGDSAEDGDSSGGDIIIEAGRGGAGNVDFGGSGGFIRVEAGRGGAATGNTGAVAEIGGDLTLNAGDAGDNNGNIDLGAAGGAVYINSGFSTGNTDNGGEIVLTTGTGGQNATSGNVRIEIPGYGNTTGGTWTFDATGNLTLPAGTPSINYANGAPYGGGGSANTGNIIFDQSTIESNQSNAYINLNALGSGVLSLGTNDQSSVRIVTDEGGVNNRWTFDDTGTLTLPGNTSSINYADGNPMLGNIAFDQSGLITNQSNAYINLNASGSGILGLGTNDATNVTITTNASSNVSKTWTFDDAGNLTLPSDGYLRVVTGIVGTGASPAPSLSGFSSVSAINISASGNITGANFFGDGSQLTGITATASLIGNLVGNLDANTFSINNLPSLSVAGNITGSFFIGNGSQLTGLPATYSNTNAQTYFASGTSNANISITGNVLTTGRVSATGNIQGNFFIGNGSQLTGLPASYSNANAQLYFASGTSNANISITGNVLTTADISAGGNVSAANFLTVGAIGTGNITGANLITANTFSAAGNVFVGAALSVAGNISVGNISVSGNITSNVTYGAFYDTTTQTNSNVGNAIPMSYNTVDINNGVTIASNTNITIAKTGVYNIQFSAQLSKSDAGTDQVYIWLDKNGTAVANSATSVALEGGGGRDVAAWNFVVDATAGDYYRLMWMSTDANASIITVAAASPVPAIPSVILTVVPVGP